MTGEVSNFSFFKTDMKKAIATLFISISLSACQQNIDDSDIEKINGYWEIEEVILPDGNKKEYKISETIDYFEVKNSKGFRKKVMPQFDGTYKANDLSEDLKISKTGNDFFIEYQTDYGKWKEQILEISDENLVLKNQQKLEYHYKKPVPFTLK